MRSYGHYCGVARALDVVGGRWTLLIVRELLVLGTARYTDLQRGLPGIATNLLAARLRDMEAAGLVVRDDPVAPGATPSFRLTPRGEALEPVISALGAWAAPLMSEYDPDDEVRSHWLALPVRLYLTDLEPDQPPITIQVHTGDEPMLLETVGGAVRARPGTAEAPDAALSGPPHLVIGVLAGRLTIPAARARGLSVRGDPAVVHRIGPRLPA